MKTPLQRLEGRVQKALDAIDAVATVTTSNSYPTTQEERNKIRETIVARTDAALENLAENQGGINFKL